jgi:hypothetical protein
MSPNKKEDNLEEWEKKVVRKAMSRKKKGRPRMKVSGAGVKFLQKIMNDK